MREGRGWGWEQRQLSLKRAPRGNTVHDPGFEEEQDSDKSVHVPVAPPKLATATAPSSHSCARPMVAPRHAPRNPRAAPPPRSCMTSSPHRAALRVLRPERPRHRPGRRQIGVYPAPTVLTGFPLTRGILARQQRRFYAAFRFYANRFANPSKQGKVMGGPVTCWFLHRDLKRRPELRARTRAGLAWYLRWGCKAENMPVFAGSMVAVQVPAGVFDCLGVCGRDQGLFCETVVAGRHACMLA